MKKKTFLRNIVLVAVPVICAVVALAVFHILPGDKQVLLEGAVEIASTSCYAQASGTVEAMLAQTGQQVRKGDILAVLDDSAVDRQVEQLRQTLEIKKAQLRRLTESPDIEAQLAARRAAQDNVALWQETLAQSQRVLAAARRDLDSQQVLYDAGVIALVELRQYDAAAELAQSQVVAAQAQLSAAQNSVSAIPVPVVDEQAVAAAQADIDLTQLQIDQLEASREDYHIRAVSDGVVISSSLETGSTVASGQNVFKLSSGARQYFVFYLPQEYLERVAFGDELILSHQGSQEEAARGMVTYIDLQAVYPPDDYQNSGNRNKRSVKIKAELTSGGPFAIGQALFLRLAAAQD